MIVGFSTCGTLFQGRGPPFTSAERKQIFFEDRFFTIEIGHRNQPE
jgi:hypothetical protein